MSRRQLFFIGIILLIAPVLTLQRNAGLAQENTADSIRKIELPAIQVELREGEGKNKTTLHCSICHSLDYITGQPGFSAERWKAIVQKMIKIFGAPVTEEEAKTIVDYLAAQYGPGQ